MILRCALLFALCPLVSTQSPDASVRLLSYDVLPAEEYYRFRNAHYAFEVCICNRPSRDPKLSRFCTCADVKGGTVREGALESDGGCGRDSTPGDGCLVASLPYFDKEPPMYYVRVSANGAILTAPGWQELTQGDAESTRVSLSAAAARSPISLTFVIVEHLQKWSNGGGVRKEAAQQQPHPLPKPAQSRKARPWFLMTSTASPLRATTTLAPSTTPAIWKEREWRDGGGENDVESDTSPNTDYLRFTGITNMWELRNFLYMESLRDQIPAYRLDIESYKQEIIAHHNAIRALHSAAPLEYDAYLEAEAQRWASVLGARSSCTAHDPNRRHGECLFYFGGLTLPNAKTLAALTVQSFYLERGNYDYDNYRPVFFYRTGHFTQLVWRATRRIGVGVHITLASGGGAPCRPYNPTYQLYVVMKYDPPGNVQSSAAYRNNVLPRAY